MRKTVIYGNGAMARVLHSYARKQLDIVGFTVDDHCIAAGETQFCQKPLIPFSRAAEAFPPNQCDIIVAVGYAEMNRLRERKCEEALRMGYALGRYLHAGLILHEGVSIGAGSIILDHVSIHPGCCIGKNVFISSNVNIGHDCVIEDGNWINAGVAIAGGSRIGAGCFFGVNASVGHGISVGSRNFIAANTFIGSDTQADQVYLSEAGQRLKMRSQDFLAMTSESGA